MPSTMCAMAPDVIVFFKHDLVSCSDWITIVILALI